MSVKPKFSVEWHDGGREPQCESNPAFPNGMHVDTTEGGEPSCTAVLKYPAPRCGWYVVQCQDCGLKFAITTAGRADDPRSVKVPCKRVN